MNVGYGESVIGLSMQSFKQALLIMETLGLSPGRRVMLAGYHLYEILPSLQRQEV